MVLSQDPGQVGSTWLICGYLMFVCVFVLIGVDFCWVAKALFLGREPKL